MTPLPRLSYETTLSLYPRSVLYAALFVLLVLSRRGAARARGAFRRRSAGRDRGGDAFDARCVALRTIFVGGGTPTVLGNDSWERIIAAHRAVDSGGRCREFTVEMNPEDVTRDMVVFLRGLGVNRASLGIQSMHEVGQKVLKRCAARSQRARHRYRDGGLGERELRRAARAFRRPRRRSARDTSRRLIDHGARASLGVRPRGGRRHVARGRALLSPPLTPTAWLMNTWRRAERSQRPDFGTTRSPTSPAPGFESLITGSTGTAATTWASDRPPTRPCEGKVLE